MDSTPETAHRMPPGDEGSPRDLLATQGRGRFEFEFPPIEGTKRDSSEASDFTTGAAEPLRLDFAEPVCAADPPNELSEETLRRLPGWMFSVALHGLLLIVCGSTLVSGTGGAIRRGSGDGDGLGIGVIEGSWSRDETSSGVSIRLDATRSERDIDMTLPSTGLSETPELLTPPIAVPAARRPSRVVPASMSSTSFAPPESRSATSSAERGSKGRGGAGDASGGDESDGAGDGDGSGNGAVRFFGLADRAVSVVYAVDCSSSMEAHGAFRAAKFELMASLQRLSPRHRFHVMFYNQGVNEMPTGEADETPLRYATTLQVKQARQFIAGVLPDLGTEHVPALRRALRLKPDAVFLLTDAADPPLSDRELTDLRRLNGGRTRIHCIEFGRGGRPEERESFLKKLARQSAGSYRYCDVTRF